MELKLEESFSADDELMCDFLSALSRAEKRGVKFSPIFASIVNLACSLVLSIKKDADPEAVGELYGAFIKHALMDAQDGKIPLPH